VTGVGRCGLELGHYAPFRFDTVLTRIESSPRRMRLETGLARIEFR
jgi:hypothetical protein